MDDFAVKRDPDIVRRILIAIEAKASRAPAPIVVEGIDRQDLLDHLAIMHEEGLFSGRVHESSSTREVDMVTVGDLTPAGRKRLEVLNLIEDEPTTQSPSAWGNSWGAPSIQRNVVNATGLQEDRHEALLSRVALLEDSMGQLRDELAARRVGIGHNRPPGPVPEEDLRWADELVALLKDRGPERPADPQPLLQQYKKAAELAARIEDGLVAAGKEMAKGAAREVGKEVLASHWAAISHWITEIGKWLLSWLNLG